MGGVGRCSDFINLLIIVGPVEGATENRGLIIDRSQKAARWCKGLHCYLYARNVAPT